LVSGEATLANRTVQLYKYIKRPSGWRYCKAAFYANNRIKPHAVLTPDGEQIIKDGYYCLAFNRKWEPVGNDPAEAVRLLMKKRGELLTVANGGSVVQEPEPAATLDSMEGTTLPKTVPGPSVINNGDARAQEMSVTKSRSASALL
jgi:hypothetical protein